MSKVGRWREDAVRHENDDNDGGAEDFDLKWIGRSTGEAERRQIVVVAVGFAAVAISDPEDIVEALAWRRSCVAAIVSRYGGNIGRVDPLLQLASWGWPLACEADTRLAVEAALEIAAAGQGRVRCAVDVGIAITPDAGDRLTGIGVVGEMPATAATLQGIAGWGRVVVSEAARRLIEEAFELIPQDGLCRGEHHWLVERRKSLLPVADGVSGGGELVGRSRELTDMLACWSRAARGEMQLLSLEGEAGIGKSALVAQLARHASDAGGHVVIVDCLPETQRKPLEPVRKLRQALQDAVASSSSTQSVIPPIGPERLAGDLDPDASPGALVETLCALIEASASDRPLLLVIEDLQWSDAATASAIDRLGQTLVPSQPVLLVTTRRCEPTTHPGGRREGSWRLLQIDRLEGIELDRLLASSEPACRLSRDIRRQIADHADGVPFCALELARLCAETPDRDAHHRLLSRPNQLNARLTALLDRLGKLKPLARVAAVVGRDFDCRLLAAVLDMDVRIVVERLDLLVGHGILTRHGAASESSYRFAHAPLWSQAYGSVLKTRRRKLHGRIAEELTRNHVRICAASPEIVAYHYSKAGDQPVAFAWWRKAADAAVKLGHAANAVAHINQALSAKIAAPEACSAVDEAELMSLLGGQLRALRGTASGETVAAYERALELIADLPSKPADLDFNITWGLAAIHLVRGDIRDAVKASGRLLEEARDRGRDDFLVLALRMQGTALLLSGRVADAIDLLSRAVAMYDPVRHGGLQLSHLSDPGASALAHLASAHAIALNREASKQARQRALILAGEIAHPHTSSNALGVLTLAAIHLGERSAAAALARASLAIAERQGHAYWAARAGLVLAWDKGHREPKLGMELVEQAIVRYNQTGAGRATVLSRCLAADIAIKAEVPHRALELLSPVKAGGHLHGEWLYIPEVVRLEAMARWRLDPDDIGGVRRLLLAAEAMATEHGSTAFAERAAATRATVENDLPAVTAFER